MRRAARPFEPPAFVLLTNAELRDDRAVALDVLRADVVEETTTAADELQKATAAVVVLRVRLEVLGEVGDPLAEERDLHLGRPAVGLVSLELLDDLSLAVRKKSHWERAFADVYRAMERRYVRHGDNGAEYECG